MKKNFVVLFLLLPFFCFCQQKKLNVYVMLAEDCPISNYMGGPLSTISKTYADSVSFFAVFPLTGSTNTTAGAFKKKHQLEKFKTVLDPKQILAKKLGAAVTPEVIITNSKEEIVYRGRINDAYLSPGRRNHEITSNDLDNNIQKALNGEPIPQPWKNAIGCYITFYN